MQKGSENDPSGAPHPRQSATASAAMETMLAELVDLARRLGASDAAVVDAAAIVAEERLARFCLPPGCPHYGLSAGCPPHVGGPQMFRDLLKRYCHGLLVKIDTSAELLSSEGSKELFRRLHRIAAGVERNAAALGCTAPRAFAGGSCRSLFCEDQTGCRVIDEGGECRYPETARPSLSGYGVNVGNLAGLAGWQMRWAGQRGDPHAGGGVSIYALILVA